VRWACLLGTLLRIGRLSELCLEDLVGGIHGATRIGRSLRFVRSRLQGNVVGGPACIAFRDKSKVVLPHCDLSAIKEAILNVT